MDLVTVRAAQARILTLRGQAAHAAPWLDWFESTSPGAATPESSVQGLEAWALVSAALGVG